MNNTAIVIISILVGTFSAVLIYVFIKRFNAKMKYGKVRKPEILKKLDNSLSIEDIRNLFSEKWKELPIDHSTYEENYYWEENDERGKWKVDFKFKGNGSWGLKDNQEFIHWTLTYESNETIYLSYSEEYCYP